MAEEAAIRIAMAGDGPGAPIGETYRAAANKARFERVAGAFSSRPESRREMAAKAGLTPERAYGSCERMIEGERGREDGAEAIIIVMPSHLHAPIACTALCSGVAKATLGLRAQA